ncbi:acyl-CoA thioester hydrolase [Corynebacterium sp. HMSC05H05]|uniref:acyl-CoA thioester hydrolase/BAAT C-terminal domain-containing protein n=1 Tax=Corynebacterium sp. HMSC05H05 TaxID=1581119 RepID=UPI0008B77D79|nr:alpha/beta fold hydrolase [Corynebacterium sp. HMSC05H05]OFT57729.1 acyl-CoA thioester hydrolase [Corynebacterium sp. HMSC05H05]
MRGLKRIGKAIVWFLGVIVVLALVVAGLRAYNANKYPIAQADASGGASAAEYPEGERVRKISGEYLNGFHFQPAEGAPERRGVVVVYGGSEGSPDYARAEALANDGYEVLSLYFFGQDNQRPTLAEVPLEQFDEVTDYIDEHVADPSPVTVVGTSKGAEFAALVAANGFAVDNLVAFVPAQYSYSGLDFSTGEDLPSFTVRGEAVPFASFRQSGMLAGLKMFGRMIAAYPVAYRPTYEGAAESAGDDARIDLSGFDGNAVLFGAGDDQMWQSDVAAKALAEQAPRAEAHVYEGAGHVFFEDSDAQQNGWQIMFGGTQEANRRAHDESWQVLSERLAEWHGQ